MLNFASAAIHPVCNSKFEEENEFRAHYAEEVNEGRSLERQKIPNPQFAFSAEKEQLIAKLVTIIMGYLIMNLSLIIDKKTVSLIAYGNLIMTLFVETKFTKKLSPDLVDEIIVEQRMVGGPECAIACPVHFFMEWLI